MRILSEAKINLTLDILGKLSDNYHSIKSIVLKIPLYDEIFIDEDEVDRVVFENENIENSNIDLVKELFFKKVNKRKNFYIKIKKNIPVGSGLGGGSSNAAKILISLNSFFDYPLSFQELASIGEKVGSDVPLFLRDEKILLIQNKGEKVFPLYLKDYEFFLLVLYPGFKISTREVYQKITKIERKEERSERVLEKLLKNENFFQYLGNDLEEYAYLVEPRLKEIKNTLLNYNALNVILSGSGSSFVSFFNSPYPMFALLNHLKVVEKYFNLSFQFFPFHVLGWEKIYRIDMQK